MTNEKDKESKLKSLISSGSEVLGSLAGAGLGLVVAGPPGALGGAAIGPIATTIIRRTCLDVYDRLAGGRGEARAGAAALHAVAHIQERVKAGQPLRCDGFFAPGTSRTPADEILEGVMLKSRDEHEEAKAPFFGNLFSSAAFDESLTPEFLNRALAQVDRLTYRQLCLLQFFETPQAQGLRGTHYVEAEGSTPQHVQDVLDEIFDLCQQGLLHMPSKDNADARLLDNSAYVMDAFQIIPAAVRQTQRGAKLAELLRLSEIPQAELMKLRTALA